MGNKRAVREKFQEERERFVLLPKNQKQQEAIQALFDKDLSVVILDGFAGVGKSYLCGSAAAMLYRTAQIEQIIVSRAYIQTGRSSGLKPGDTLQKLYPYVRTILDPVSKVMGKGAYEVALKDGTKGNVRVQELESIRGMSFDGPSFLIIDEAQQTTPEEMESIVTRIGENCKLVLCGDIRQKDIKGKSGLEWFIEFANRHQIEGVAHIVFGIQDCVRSGFVKDVLIGIEKDKGNLV